MKFFHKDNKKKIFETDNKNLFSMLEREGYEPQGGWEALKDSEEEESIEEE